MTSCILRGLCYEDLAFSGVRFGQNPYVGRSFHLLQLCNPPQSCPPWMRPELPPSLALLLNPGLFRSSLVKTLSPFLSSSRPARGVRWPAARVAAAIAGHAGPQNRRLSWLKLFGRSRALVGDTNCPLCHGAWRCPSRGAPAWHGGKQRPCAGGARRRSSGVLCHRLIIADGFHGQALQTA
jgi:hypothetical protein